MTIKIDHKIVGYQVEKPEDAAPKVETKATSAEGKVIRMHEKLERPEMLIGSTYKVKPPVADHAMYVTINDILLNEGTPHENRRPFEIFINSKNLDHYQWIVALTRIISAVFRKGGDSTFLVEELKAVFDPRGGYWQPGGKFMPSIIAELGHIIEKHMISIGLIQIRQIPVVRGTRAHILKFQLADNIFEVFQITELHQVSFVEPLFESCREYIRIRNLNVKFFEYFM